MFFSCKKGEFDRCFNRLDPPVEESRPDRFPFLYRYRTSWYSAFYVQRAAVNEDSYNRAHTIKNTRYSTRQARSQNRIFGGQTKIWEGAMSSRWG